MQVNAHAENYISLCFELERYIPGLVDAYFGPPNLREQAGTTPTPLNDLIESIEDSMRALSAKAFTPTERRIGFLYRQLRALRMLAVVARGDTVPYLEEVAGIYDIRPVRVPESTYEKSLAEIAHLLPGAAPLADRLDTFRKQFEIPPTMVREIFADALEYTRSKTKGLIPLPENETFEMSLVTDKPWSGYNWFKGSAHSLIEINTDLPRRIDHVLHLMSHEGYPGHHTDISTKEHTLFRGNGWLEFSMHPLYSPQSVIAEGIAETAGEIIYSQDEALAYMRDSIARRLGKRDLDFPKLMKISSLFDDLRSVAANASILLFSEMLPESEVFDYLRQFALIDRAFAEKRLQFLKIYRGYIYTYYYGYDLLKAYFSGKDARAEFIKLLSEPAYPSLFEMAGK